MTVSPTARHTGHRCRVHPGRAGPEPGLLRAAPGGGAWPETPISGHQLLLPPAHWCPIFASRATQAFKDHPEPDLTAWLVKRAHRRYGLGGAGSNDPDVAAAWAELGRSGYANDGPVHDGSGVVRASNSGRQLLLPPAHWCPVFASRTTQAWGSCRPGTFRRGPGSTWSRSPSRHSPPSAPSGVPGARWYDSAFPCVLPPPSRLRHCLCLVCSTALATKTLPLPCVFPPPS